MAAERPDISALSEFPFFNYAPHESSSRVSMCFEDLRDGLAAIASDLDLWHGTRLVRCCPELFDACAPDRPVSHPDDLRSIAPECPLLAVHAELSARIVELTKSRWELQYKANRSAKDGRFNAAEEFFALSKEKSAALSAAEADLDRVHRAMAESASVAPLSAEEFRSLAALLEVQRGEPSGRAVLKRLSRNFNFEVRIGAVRIECNRLVAASACRRIAARLAIEPEVTCINVPLKEGEVPERAVTALERLLHGKRASIHRDTQSGIAVLAEKLGICKFKLAVDEREREQSLLARAERQLELVIEFQSCVDRLSEETESELRYRKNHDFGVDPELCESIIEKALYLNPRMWDTYCEWLDARKARCLRRSSFLEVIWSDDVKAFQKQCFSHRVMNSAVLALPWSKWLGYGGELPLISVVAFYGAVNCLKVLLRDPDTVASISEMKVHPLLFAIGGGNTDAIQELEDPQVPFHLRVAFALSFRQESVFESLLSSLSCEEAAAFGRRYDLLRLCVDSGWFFGVKYCLQHRQSLVWNVENSLQQAISSGNLAMFRLLLRFGAKRYESAWKWLAKAIKSGDCRMVRLVLGLVQGVPDDDQRLEYLICAVERDSTEMLDLIWGLCNVDQILRNSQCSDLATVVMKVQNPGVIKRLVNYIKVILTSDQLALWVTSLVKARNIPGLDSLCRGNYRRFDLLDPSPLNGCRDVETARHLLRNGINPHEIGKDGKSPLDHAKDRSDSELCQLYEESSNEFTEVDP